MTIRPLLLLSLAIPLSHLDAQAVKGTLVADGSLAPVAGAVVLQVEPSGRTAAVATSDSTGRFEFRNPGVDGVALWVLRVGYAPSPLTPPSPAAGAPETRFALPMNRLALPAVNEDGEFACGPGAWKDGRLSALWTQGRTVLLQVDGVLRSARYEFDAKVWSGKEPGSALMPATEMDTVGEPVTLTEWPIPGAVAESLMSIGFIGNPRGTWNPAVWYAPDPGLLLSSEFREQFCFRVVTSDLTPLLPWYHPAVPEGWVGIEFRPDRSTEPPSVRGVLWLDPSSAELRTIEWRYVNLPKWGHPPRGDLGGGRIEIAQFPNGVRFARRWRMRVPVPSNPHDQVQEPTNVDQDIGQWHGEVTAVRDVSPVAVGQVSQ